MSDRAVWGNINDTPVSRENMPNLNYLARRECRHNDIQTDRFFGGPPGAAPALRFTCKECGKVWGDEAEAHAREEACRALVAEVRTWSGPVLSKEGQPAHWHVRDVVCERLEAFLKAKGWS